MPRNKLYHTNNKQIKQHVKDTTSSKSANPVCYRGFQEQEHNPGEEIGMPYSQSQEQSVSIISILLQHVGSRYYSRLEHKATSKKKKAKDSQTWYIAQVLKLSSFTNLLPVASLEYTGLSMLAAFPLGLSKSSPVFLASFWTTFVMTLPTLTKTFSSTLPEMSLTDFVKLSLLPAYRTQ